MALSQVNLTGYCTRHVGQPQGDTRGVERAKLRQQVLQLLLRSNGCDTKMEIMRLKKDLQMKDCGACLVDHDQSCDNSKAMTKNKIMTFSPVRIPR